MKALLLSHLRTRGPLVALAAGLGVAARLSHPYPEERTLDGVSALVARATDTSHVESGAWEPSRGLLLDFVDGRAFLFVARAGDDQPRDVYRSFVRVAPDGSPLTVTRSRNLTRTALADEQGLLVRGPFAAFATAARDEVLGVTVLDARGARRTPEATGWNRLREELQLGVDAFLVSGAPSGLGRTDLELTPPSPGLQLELAHDELTLQTSGGGLTVAALHETPQLRTHTEAVTPSVAGSPAILMQRLDVAEPFAPWLTKTSSAVLGESTASWLEARALALVDAGRRLTSARKESVASAALHSTQGAASSRSSSAPSAVWPPARLAISPTESEFAPLMLPFASSTRTSESAFYRASLRPDPERPFADVVLLALDMRRLELGLALGSGEPHVVSGLPGRGRLPADIAQSGRVVALFDAGGASSSSSNAPVLGRVEAGRPHAPPLAGAPTTYVDRAGRVGLGTWPGSNDAGLSRIVSLRQNEDALIEDGRVAAPRPSALTAQGPAVVTERSALCATRPGQLLYAWSKHIDRAALAEALRRADCAYATSLSVGSGRGAFLFVDPQGARHGARTATSVDTRMSERPGFSLEDSRRDFLYVALRENVPRSPGTVWQVDEGEQPPPSNIPAAFTARRAFGELELELARFEGGRFRWSVGPSRNEATKAVVDTELPPDEAATVLAAVGLGHTTEATRHGLRVGTQTLVPFQRALATLVLPEGGDPYVVPSGSQVTLPERGDAVQLPVLAVDGQLTARARELGGLRKRGALCVDESGNLLVARVAHDSGAPVARVLVELGCSLVLDLDRGSHSAPFVERAASGHLVSATSSVTRLRAHRRDAASRVYVGVPR